MLFRPLRLPRLFRTEPESLIISVSVEPLCGAHRVVTLKTQSPFPPSNRGETLLPEAFFSVSLPYSRREVRSLTVAPPKLCPTRFIRWIWPPLIFSPQPSTSGLE